MSEELPDGLWLLSLTCIDLLKGTYKIFRTPKEPCH